MEPWWDLTYTSLLIKPDEYHSPQHSLQKDLVSGACLFLRLTTAFGTLTLTHITHKGHFQKTQLAFRPYLKISGLPKLCVYRAILNPSLWENVPI